MFEGKRVAVVVPAYNEERMLRSVVESMPSFVDHIIVVDDCSQDRTAAVLNELAESMAPRLIPIFHERNQGVGATIVTGYKWARDQEIDVTAVMAGDGQMDPAQLESLIRPILAGQADYVKGNRFLVPRAWEHIPKVRFLGNSVLSLLTKISSGYWHIADSQCGYTAINLECLQAIDLNGLYPRYGFPNDILVQLNIESLRVMDVPVKPLYNIGERSDMRIWKVCFTIASLLGRRFLRRMWQKYVIRDFHPLVFFYALAGILLPAGILLGVAILYYNTGVFVPPTDRLEVGWIVLSSLLLIAGVQSLFFAMWFDMDYNRQFCIFFRESKVRHEAGLRWDSTTPR